MKTLEERLEERKAEYERLCEGEWILEDLIAALELDPERLGHSYPNAGTIFLTIFSQDEEWVGIELIPRLSELLGKGWSSWVDEKDLNFSLYGKFKNWSTVAYIYLTPEDSCSIKKVATGRTKTVRKYVSIEEPEYEYIMNCGGE